MQAAMSAIVTSTYRYKRPPRRRKPVALEVLAIVRATKPKPAIVTARRLRAVSIPAGLLPDTSEEHQRRGAAADALLRETKHRIAEKVR